MTCRTRLAIIASHPIQYQTPWFRALAETPGVDLEVFFGHQATAAQQAGAGFGVPFEWDIPLLDGYSHSFLRNVAAAPSLASFRGIDTPEIADVVARGHFDALIVHGWQFKNAWQAIVACWRTGTPVMVRGDSHLHSPRAAATKIAKWPLYRAFMPRFDACLAAGTWSRDYFLHYGAPAGRVFVVPHVIDLDRFGAEAARLRPLRHELRRKWALDESAVVALFVGKFLERKRPMDFIAAVERVSSVNRRVMGLMVGDGPLRAACETRVVQRQVPIRFAGFLNQAEIVQAYVAADVLVLPSDGRETWGLVVNEAMAVGCPAIVTDAVGCGPDLVDPGRTGARVPLGDVEGLARAIDEWSDARTLQSARPHLEDKVTTFSPARAVERTLVAVTTVRRER